MENMYAKHPQLLFEYRVYRLLAGAVGVPQARYFFY